MTAHYYDEGQPWAAELRELQRILLDCGLEETQKWMARCFMDQGRNIALLGPQKAHANVGFVRGVLLDDPEGLLHQPGANSRIVRTLQFTSVDDIRENEDAIRALVAQAVDLARRGIEVPKRDDDLELPEEMEERLAADTALREAFEALTPGRQRGYAIYVGGAKRSATRADRFEKQVERIMMGKGLRDCICGKSKRMPSCDGSHNR